MSASDHRALLAEFCKPNRLLPETVHNVELICGDWLGGALISATNRPDEFGLILGSGAVVAR
jgi:hypothetical protein